MSVATVRSTRDPAAYRRKRREEIIEKAAQIRKCYLAYRPPQIRYQRPMKKCSGGGPVLPVFRGRVCQS